MPVHAHLQGLVFLPCIPQDTLHKQSPIKEGYKPCKDYEAHLQTLTDEPEPQFTVLWAHITHSNENNSVVFGEIMSVFFFPSIFPSKQGRHEWLFRGILLAKFEVNLVSESCVSSLINFFCWLFSGGRTTVNLQLYSCGTPWTSLMAEFCLPS